MREMPVIAIHEARKTAFKELIWKEKETMAFLSDNSRVMIMPKKLLFATCASLLLMTSAAIAENGSNVKISFSKDADKAFNEKYGAEEKVYIEKLVRDEIQKSLGSEYSVDVFVESATPNRPTMYQMAQTPSLSFQSFSLGGADMTGKVFDKNGNQVGEVHHKYYTPSIYEAQYSWTWHDADWAIEKFASKLKNSVK